MLAVVVSSAAALAVPASAQVMPGADTTAHARALARSVANVPTLTDQDSSGLANLAVIPARMSCAQLARTTKVNGQAIQNVQAREDLRSLADEQGALRRVATLAGHHDLDRAAGRWAIAHGPVYVRYVEQGTTFLTVLRRLAAADPGRPALTYRDETLTRAELVQRVEGLAALFAERGVTQGSTVTIGLPNSVGFVLSMFATWALGAVPNPISDRLPPLERAAIVDLAQSDLVVGVPSAQSGSRPVLEAVPAQLPVTEFTPGVSPDWKLMTSGGSTGRPKLIAASQPAVFENVGTAAPLICMPPEGCVLMTGPLAHNGPFAHATVGMLTGNHVVLMPRFDPAETLRLVSQHRVTYLLLVPTMMLRIWRLPQEVRLAADVSSLEVAFHLAAPCPAWLKQAWIDWLGPEKVVELYGGTELQAVTVINGTEWLAHPGSVGRTVLGEIEIRDPGGRPVPVGEEGELWMRRGPQAPSPYRYLGATARSAPDGWESLGDIGKVDADGYVYITDRLADMILVGGANVYPAEIEAALDEHPAVRSCCVFGLPDEDLGSIPYAIVELLGPASDEDLLAHLRQRLAPYKLPRAIERATAPLRDDAGKVRRSALRAERIARQQPVAGRP